MSRLLVSTAFAGLLLSGGASLAASQNVPVPALIPAAMLGNAFQQPNNNQQNNNNQNNNDQHGQKNGGDGGNRANLNDRGSGGGDHGNGGDRGAAQQNNQAAHQNNQNNNVQRSQNDRGGDRSNFRDNGNGGANRNGSDQRDFRDSGNNNRGGLDRRQGSNFRNGPGPRSGGHDFSSYHRNFNAPHRFRAQTYRRPSGWYAHHWVFGETLPGLFWTSNYWLDDFSDFGLMPPPPGTVWVRDGSDALLIDRYDGAIIQVAYDVFY